MSIVNENEINNNLELENEEFLEKLNEYYKMKNDYDTKKMSIKNTILKDDTLTMKQKQDKYKKYKINCVNCTRRVGTIFQIDDGILKAICGDKVKPCSLDIKINRGKFLLLEELLETFQEGVDDLKEDIIKVKLDLLFNYKNEADVLIKFSELKKELEQDLEALMEYKTKLIERTNNLTVKSELKTKMENLYNKINLIKSTMEEFNETGQTQLVKDTVVLYDSELKPLINEIQELKYKYFNIEYVDGKYKLIRKKYTLNELIEPFSSPSVERFEVSNIDNANRNLEDDVSEKINNVDMDLDMELDDSDDNEVDVLSQEAIQKPNEVKIVNNQILFGSTVLINKYDYDTNRELFDNLDTIKVSKATDLKYKLEMIYVEEGKPELIGIDSDNGNIYRILI